MRIENAGYTNSLSGRERMRFEGRHASWLLGELNEALEVDLREDRRENVRIRLFSIPDPGSELFPSRI
jgi:hypothetical protein